MSSREGKSPEYIKFPYDLFLMLRLEYLALCKDENEAKIMRIIESIIVSEWDKIYRERCGSVPKDQQVPMPDNVWVVIPNRYFMDRLFGTIQSETTLKNTIHSLLEKKFVFRNDRPGRYDAPEYTLNRKAIIAFFATLPAEARQLDIMAIMKPLRKPRKGQEQGEQSLTPSEGTANMSDTRGTKFDPLNNCPPESQLLAPSTPIIDPLSERGGGQLLTPTNSNRDSYQENYQEDDSTQNAAAFVHVPTLSQFEEMQQQLVAQAEHVAHLEALLQQVLAQNAIPTAQSVTAIEQSAPAAEIDTEHSYSQGIQATIENQEDEEAQPPLLDAPLSEPDMTGKWVAWKPVRYAEWKNGKRYTENQFNKQLEASRKIKRENSNITLGQYKQVHNHWFDWWTENRCEPLHVSDVAGKQKNGMPRVQSAVDRIEMQKNKPALGNQNVTAFKQRSTTQSAAQKITTEQAVQQGFQTLTMEQKKRLLLDFPDPEERRAHIQEMRQQQQQAVSAK